MEQAVLDKINQIAKQPLTADEVYTFDLILCDNEVDRDGEAFTLAALKSLQTLYIGKTGISDHDPKESKQKSRIFDTALITDASRRTKSGEAYTYLKARAYMLRLPEHASMIREIDGGIKKEVSISAAAKKCYCSICGVNRHQKTCSHSKGKTYGGKLCYHILDEITDVYEWSFVAVPAQVNAGVMKHFGMAQTDGTGMLKAVQRQLAETEALLDEVRGEIQRDVIRLCAFRKSGTYTEVLAAAVERMTIAELMAFRKALRMEQPERVTPQLAPAGNENLESFKL